MRDTVSHFTAVGAASWTASILEDYPGWGGGSSSSGAAVDNPACFIANIITLISASGLRVLACSRVPPPPQRSLADNPPHPPTG